jgi:alcohol dehydrogenase YqhD (iron-dependent ADH family)
VTSAPRPVDVWSSPTTVYAGGLAQLPAALAGRPAVLFADERLTVQLAAVTAAVRPRETVLIGAGASAELITAALARHPAAVPVALGGGGVMDLVLLAVLATVEPAAAVLDPAADGVRMLPTRAVNPTICLPTTLGTAAEVSPVAVRHHAGGTAMLVSPGLRPAAAVLDPVLTGTLPAADLLAGLVEPWARVVVPAVAGPPLLLQDGLVRSIADTLTQLGTAGPDATADPGWRLDAALASVATHLCPVALGRPPAGHQLWPLATEVTRVTGCTKAVALAALVAVWLHCVLTGRVGRVWGAPERVRTVLGDGAGDSAGTADWLRGLGLPVRLPARTDVDRVVRRVLDPWQASGLFLPGVSAGEVETVLATAVREP